MGSQADGFIGLFKMGLSSQGLESSENFLDRWLDKPLCNHSRDRQWELDWPCSSECSLLSMNRHAGPSASHVCALYCLRVLESRFRNISRPELILR